MLFHSIRDSRKSSAILKNRNNGGESVFNSSRMLPRDSIREEGEVFQLSPLQPSSACNFPQHFGRFLNIASGKPLQGHGGAFPGAWQCLAS